MVERESGSGESVVPKEIERKFLIGVAVEEVPGIEDAEKITIAQGYLVVSDRAAIRVRQEGEKYFMTYKGAPLDHAAERVEINEPITRELFEHFWPATAGSRVQKTRYRVPLQGYVVDLDVFEGDHAGGVMAEVEFSSTAAADLFQPPEWFAQEVTADKRYGNASIAEHGFPVAA